MSLTKLVTTSIVIYFKHLIIVDIATNTFSGSKLIKTLEINVHFMKNEFVYPRFTHIYFEFLASKTIKSLFWSYNRFHMYFQMVQKKHGNDNKIDLVLTWSLGLCYYCISN